MDKICLYAQALLACGQGALVRTYVMLYLGSKKVKGGEFGVFFYKSLYGIIYKRK